MNATEAAEIVEAIASSMRNNPAQFHLSISVIGQQVTSYGGTGLSVSASGGGPGSSTIGQVVSTSGGQIQISQQRGIQAFEQQLNDLIASVNEIAQQLRQPTPDRSTIKRILDSFANTWVPGVVTSVIGSVVTKSLGL